MGVRGNDEVILRRRKDLGDAEYHLAGEAHQFLVDAQHQRDHIGLAGAKAHTSSVRLVTDLLGNQPHALLGFRADVRRILQRTRHGGDAKTRHVGDGLQGRALARCRLRFVPAGITSIVHVISPRFAEQ
ncbi:hypothetical protein D3C87_1294190 [compost metagenome]